MENPIITVLIKKESSAAGDVRVRPYKNQNYCELKNKHLRGESLFEDPEFKACPCSIGIGLLSHLLELELDPSQKVVWKRPRELLRFPDFIHEGMHRMDVVQQKIGDCWFMAAAATLTLNPRLLARVVPKYQSFDKGDYAGIFHFQFWQYGEWVDVVVDDRLPTMKDHLIFASSHTHKFPLHGHTKEDPNEDVEFWVPLLEKAYAKLHGSYEAIENGWASDALVDFTGGIGKLITDKTDLFKTIQKEAEKNPLMAAGINKGSQLTKEELAGLKKGHAYSIIKAQKVFVGGEKVKLVQLYNPWGGDTEWSGSWGDNSPKWKMLDSETRKKFPLKDKDGEFWMEDSDVKKCFDTLYICQLIPSFHRNSCLHGRWVKGHSAGGSQKGYLWQNPQFHVKLLESDEEQLKKQQQGLSYMKSTCTLVVSLMQKDRRRLREDNLDIGFQIFQMPEKYLQMNAGQRKEVLSKQAPLEIHYSGLREVSQEYSLPTGDYLIIPSTVYGSEEGDFALRIFTDKNHKISEIGEEIKIYGTILKDLTGQDQKVEKIFSQYAGTDHQVEPTQFWLILNQSMTNDIFRKMRSFSFEECEKLIQHCSGSTKMTLPDFQQLCRKLMEWEDIFKRYEVCCTSKMNLHDMPFALKDAGFSLNTQTREWVVKNDGAHWQTIDFKRFVFIMVHLECVFRFCKRCDYTGSGEVRMTEKEWKDIVESFYPLQEASMIPHLQTVPGQFYSNPLPQAH